MNYELSNAFQNTYVLNILGWEYFTLYYVYLNTIPKKYAFNTTVIISFQVIV